jgi:hypothetical protein
VYGVAANGPRQRVLPDPERPYPCRGAQISGCHGAPNRRLRALRRVHGGTARSVVPDASSRNEIGSAPLVCFAEFGSWGSRAPAGRTARPAGGTSGAVLGRATAPRIRQPRFRICERSALRDQGQWRRSTKIVDRLIGRTLTSDRVHRRRPANVQRAHEDVRRLRNPA